MLAAASVYPLCRSTRAASHIILTNFLLSLPLQAQTSRYHGVRLNKRTQKWEAYIRVAGKHVHLGCYDSEVAAAQVRTHARTRARACLLLAAEISSWCAATQRMQCSC
jgi:AP2 domain